MNKILIVYLKNGQQVTFEPSEWTKYDVRPMGLVIYVDADVAGMFADWAGFVIRIDTESKG